MKKLTNIYRSTTSFLLVVSLVIVTTAGMNRSAVCSMKSKTSSKNCCQKASTNTGSVTISKSNSCHCPLMTASVQGSFDEITPQTSNISIKIVDTIQLISFESDIDASPVTFKLHSLPIPSPPDHDRIIFLQSFLI